MQRNLLAVVAVQRNLLAVVAVWIVLLVGAADAQWQTPNHSTPIGRGPGVTGFNSAAPGNAGNLLTSRGAGLDPTFQPPAGLASTYGASVFTNVGTTCNGTADDTAGIQAVLSGGNSYVFIPPGFTCRASTLTVPAGTTFRWNDATIKKIGTAAVNLLNVGGAGVKLLGGTLDGNGVTPGGAGVFCQTHNDLTIDGVTFTGFAQPNIYIIDCASPFILRNSRLLGGDSVDGIGSVFYAFTGDTADVTMQNNFCDRQGSIAVGGETCFDIVGNTSPALRGFLFENNNCTGVSTGSTLFQACLQIIAATVKGMVVSNNQSRYCNYCYTFNVFEESTIIGNTAKDVLSVGYTYEASQCKNSTFSGNTADGTMNSVGSMVLINVANDCVFTGNTFKNATVDAAASTVTFNSAAPKGSRNIVSNNTIVIAGGTGITVSNDNSIVIGNVISGGATAINLTGGTGRIVVGNVVTGQSGTPIINADATDIICGNNVLGCNSATANTGVIEYRSTVNFNSANTDTAFTITLPPGVSRYQVTGVTISGASASLTTSTAGVFTAAAGAGVAVVTGASAVTVSTASDATNNNSQSMTVNNSGTESYTATTLYFRVATPQGSAATGTVTLRLIPVS